MQIYRMDFWTQGEEKVGQTEILALTYDIHYHVYNR